MAFESNRLISITAGAPGFNVYRYVTPDAVATVEGAGYFNPVASILAAGDLILATTSAGGTPELKLYLVKSSNGGSVTVAPLAANTTTGEVKA